MRDIEAFIRARREEREALALACLPGPWLTGTQAGLQTSERVDIGRIIFGRSNYVSHGQKRSEWDKWGQVANLEMAWKHKEHIRHIAAHDPDYVLADVAAKRKILDLLDLTEDRSIHADAWVIAMRILEQMALPYAGHAEYDEQWRPA